MNLALEKILERIDKNLFFYKERGCKILEKLKPHLNRLQLIQKL